MVIINQTMAKRYWPNESPIGKQIRLDYVPDEPLREIVGVVGDIRMSRQQRQINPTIYVPYRQQTPRWMGAGYAATRRDVFHLADAGNPMALETSVRQATAEVDPNRPVADMRTVEQYLTQQVQYVRLYVLCWGFSGRLRGAGGDWDLWRDGVFGGGTDARDRDSHGFGRQRPGYFQNGGAARADPIAVGLVWVWRGRLRLRGTWVRLYTRSKLRTRLRLWRFHFCWRWWPWWPVWSRRGGRCR